MPKKLLDFEHVSYQLRLSKQPEAELLMPALVTISGGQGAYKGQDGLWNMRQQFGFASGYLKENLKQILDQLSCLQKLPHSPMFPNESKPAPVKMFEHFWRKKKT